jgi:hypothetical protein
MVTARDLVKAFGVDNKNLVKAVRRYLTCIDSWPKL